MTGMGESKIVSPSGGAAAAYGGGGAPDMRPKLSELDLRAFAGGMGRRGVVDAADSIAGEKDGDVSWRVGGLVAVEAAW